MKILCVLLACVILLSGCSMMSQQEQPPAEHNMSFAGTGNFTVEDADGQYIVQGGMMSSGQVTDLPIKGDDVDSDDTDDSDDIDDSKVPPVSDQTGSETGLTGKWEYIDTLTYVYTLTFHEQGGVELEQYYRQEDGQLSRFYSMSCRPEYENDRVTFPSDWEYGPPSLVLQLEYVEGVGDILSVVSSADSLSDLTEYFHRVG